MRWLLHWKQLVTTNFRSFNSSKLLRTKRKPTFPGKSRLQRGHGIAVAVWKTMLGPLELQYWSGSRFSPMPPFPSVVSLINFSGMSPWTLLSSFLFTPRNKINLDDEIQKWLPCVSLVLWWLYCPFLVTFLGQYNQEMHKPFWSTDSGNNKNHLIFLEYSKTNYYYSYEVGMNHKDGTYHAVAKLIRHCLKRVCVFPNVHLFHASFGLNLFVLRYISHKIKIHQNPKILSNYLKITFPSQILLNWLLI